MKLDFMAALELMRIFTPDGLAQLRVVVERAGTESPDAARQAVFREYPRFKEVLEVALARDREGAFQYVCEVGEESYGALGLELTRANRATVYQIYDWLQGALDSPAPAVLTGGRESGAGSRG